MCVAEQGNSLPSLRSSDCRCTLAVECVAGCSSETLSYVKHIESFSSANLSGSRAVLHRCKTVEATGFYAVWSRHIKVYQTPYQTPLSVSNPPAVRPCFYPRILRDLHSPSPLPDLFRKIPQTTDYPHTSAPYSTVQRINSNISDISPSSC